MAPLIVHGVSEEELFIGADGIKRPYAMIYPHQEGHHRRRGVAESGSFGKSTRRSRSHTNTPGATGGTPRRTEDVTLAGADKVFNTWFSTFNADFTNNAVSAAPQSAAAVNPTAPTRPSGLSQTTLATDLDDTATQQPTATKNVRRMQPTEVVLRGYRSTAQQYAAINHYEQLAGRICEDYPREPPAEQRRYKSELRDRAVTSARRLTAEERKCVNQAASGAHWVKITFESAEAADAALFASPQTVLGHRVYAELWAGKPPAKDEPEIDLDRFFNNAGGRDGTNGAPEKGMFGKPMRRRKDATNLDNSPTNSQASSRTLDTATLSANSTTLTSGTLRGFPTAWPESSTAITPIEPPAEPVPEPETRQTLVKGVRRVQLLPAERAVLPGRTWTQWFLAVIPFLKWFTGSMIGNEVPRTEMGDFDWDRASLYWKLIWWLDITFALFGGEIVSASDKDD